MRANVIVIAAPSFDSGSRLVKVSEPVCVKALSPEGSVEGFDMSVVGGFARSREVDSDAMLISPKIHDARSEFTPVIAKQC